MGWVRMNASWDSERRHRRVGVFGRMAIRAAILLSKERDWKVDDERGFVPRAEFDAEEVVRHLELADADLARYVAHEQLLEELTRGIEACVREGLLVEGVDGWWIDGWQTYVPDPGARERQQESRRRRREAASRGVTVGHSDNRDGARAPGKPRKSSGSGERVTGVTVGHSDKAAQARAEATVSRSARNGHSDNRDVTVRDAPPEEETTSPPPPEDGTNTGASERAPDPPLPGVRPWPAASGIEEQIRRAENELRGIEVDASDGRRAEARFLRTGVGNRRDKAWFGEVAALLARPRTPARAVRFG